MKLWSRKREPERFVFHYYRDPVSAGCPSGKAGVCWVEIKDEQGQLTVTVREPEELAITSVMARFEYIATKVYYDSLLNENPRAIRWKYYDVKDLAGQEIMSDVTMKWNGEHYEEPKWINRHVIADYRVREVSFVGDKIQLLLGWDEKHYRTVMLPLKKYRVLEEATDEKRSQNIAGSGDFIRWYTLGFKLHVRNAVLDNEANP